MTDDYWSAMQNQWYWDELEQQEDDSAFWIEEDDDDGS